MKTEILKQVSCLGLERTFFNLKFAQSTVIDLKKEAGDDFYHIPPTEENKRSIESFESNDSGIETIVKPQCGSHHISQVLLPSLNDKH